MNNLQRGTDDDLQPGNARRHFLRFLAGSPLLAHAGSFSSLAALAGAAPVLALAQNYDVLRMQSRKVGDIIEAPEDALDLMDFEPAATKALPPAHYGYLATGVDADATLRRNQEDFGKVRIKVQRLVDVRKIGGVRRGTDVYKALALGATGVGLGRPYCWGLAAFGQPGVAAVLAILNREFETIMRQAGTVNLKQVTAATVNSDLA